jgi:radical SAM superfamily enzyme YgiQ (UPF0313 family)
MKIYFIQSTPYFRGKRLIKKKRLYFVGLAPAILAALVPDVQFEVCLETLEDVNFETDADLIAISGMGHAMLRSIDIADVFREKKKTVVMGGYMASLMPEEAKKHADSVVIGDGEEAFVRMVRDFRAGELQPFYDHPLKNLTYPLPRYDMLMAKKIGDFLPVQAGRGCPNSCSFCSVYCLYRNRYIKRDLGEVLRDIREIKRLGYRKFLLLDDNIYSDKIYLAEFCDEIKKLNMKWMSQCSITVANDPDMLKRLADSGCITLSFGLESISQESLNTMQKCWAKAGRYSEQIQAVEAVGIDVSAEMVVGADGDTPESIENTADFVIKNKITIPRFYILTPIPGTDFWREMKAQARIVNDDIYSYDGAKAVHLPKNMAPEELTAAYWRLYRKVFSVKSILSRTVIRRGFFRHPLKYLFYLYVNLYYRHQIRQGITPNII